MDEAVSAFDNDRPGPELQLIDSEKQNRYPLSSRPISMATAHAHISIQAQASVYKEYLRILLIRTKFRPTSSDSS